MRGQSVWPDLCGSKPYRWKRQEEPCAIFYKSTQGRLGLRENRKQGTQTPPAPSPGRLWGPPANDHGDLSSTLLPLAFPRPAVSPEITLILLSVYGPCWQVGPLVFVTEDKGLHTYECSTLKPGWFFVF